MHQSVRTHCEIYSNDKITTALFHTLTGSSGGISHLYHAHTDVATYTGGGGVATSPGPTGGSDVGAGGVPRSFRAPCCSVPAARSTSAHHTYT